MKIENAEQLLGHGDRDGRALVLGIAEEALARVDAYPRIRSLVRVEDEILFVGDRAWDLGAARNVYLIGAGKACNAMAMALEHALGDRLTRGIAIVKIAEADDDFTRTDVHVGGHPLPDRAGADAAQAVLDLVDAAEPDDLFIVVISGGSSALMSAPIAPITVDDEARATEVLLTSGLAITEVNAVRRHISRTNGGRLAQRILARGATLIGIGISDAIGRAGTDRIAEPDPFYTGTPIGPDPTTLADARAVIDDHDLRARMPSRILDFLDAAGPAHETPKELPGATYFLINTLPDLAQAAVDAARARGLDAHVLTTSLEGESRDAGTVLAALAREIQTTGRPFAAPCVVVSGGETITHIRPDAVITGHGGPSQELALGFALTAHRVPGSCLYAMDSEGTDGTSPSAGGLTDSTTAARAAAAGVDLRAALRGHASFEALSSLDDVVITGNTGTNLCDLNVLYVPARGESA